MLSVLFVLLSLAFFTVGETASKFWADKPTWKLGIGVIALYMVGSCLWLPAIYCKNHLTTLGTFWNIGAVICTVLVGYFVFHEHVTVAQSFGIILAFVSCILLSI